LIDRQTYVHLQDVIRRQGRSFLQYAGESFPWNTSEQEATVQQLHQLANEERDGAAALSGYLVKNRLTPPYLGAYPSYFTSYNFMSLDRLLPLLVQHQERGVGELETDLKSVRDEETHKQVAEILAMKRRHLQALVSLVTSHAPV
jgi:hypothetical protein